MCNAGCTVRQKIHKICLDTEGGRDNKEGRE